MTEGEMREVVEAVLGEVHFESPVSVGYCVAVRDALRVRLPPGAVLDVCHLRDELRVDARTDSRRCLVVVPLA